MIHNCAYRRSFGLTFQKQAFDKIYAFVIEFLDFSPERLNLSNTTRVTLS